jgi:ankyrin repeat protein
MFGWLYNSSRLFSSPYNGIRFWWNGWNAEGARKLWLEAVEQNDMPLAKFLHSRNFTIVGEEGDSSLLNQIIENKFDIEKLDFILTVDPELINKRYDVKVGDVVYEGVTLLMYAIIQGKNDLAEHLLTMNDINVNIRSDEGRTALQYAKTEQKKLVEEIIKMGPDLRNGNAEYVFHKFPSAANLMIKQCADQMHVIYIAVIDTEQSLDIEFTPALLREAFLHALEEKGEGWLLQREGFLNQVMVSNNFNFKDQNGQTLLTHAIQKGCWQLAEIMQAKGATLNGLPAELSKNLLEACVEGKNTLFFKTILDKYAGRLKAEDVKKLFLLTAEKGNLEICQKLLSSKVVGLPGIEKSVNDNGATALHIAAQHEQANIAKKLLFTYKWDLGQQDNEGHSHAFHIFNMSSDIFDGKLLAHYQEQTHVLFVEALHAGKLGKLKEISAQDLVCEEGALGYTISAGYAEVAADIAAAIVSSNASGGQWPSLHGVPIIRWDQAAGDELTKALELIVHKLHDTYDANWAEVAAQLLSANVSLDGLTKEAKQDLFNNMVLAGKIGVAAALKNQADNVDVNAKIDGNPLIFHTLDLKQSDAFQYLLENKADLNAYDKNRCTVIERAIKDNSVDIVLKLLQGNVHIKGSEWELLRLCDRPEVSDADAVKIINRVSDNLQKNKDSALLYLVQRGEYGLVKKVLGASNPEEAISGINAHDYASRKTVLHILLDEGKISCAQQLLKHDVELNAVDYKAKTPLMYAAQKGQMVEDIIEKAFNTGKVLSVNAKDADGKTALMYAAENGRSAPLKAILDYKLAGVPQTDLDAKDNMGNTALAHAAQGDKVMAVKFILAKMHDLDVKSEASILDFCGKNWYGCSLWGSPYVNDDVKSILETLAQRNSLDSLTYVLQKGNFTVLNKVVGSYAISEVFASKDAGGKAFVQYLVEDKSRPSLELVEKIADKCGPQKLQALYNLALDADNGDVLSLLDKTANSSHYDVYKADGYYVVVVEGAILNQEVHDEQLGEAAVAPSAPAEHDLYAPRPSAPPSEGDYYENQPGAPYHETFQWEGYPQEGEQVLVSH